MAVGRTRTGVQGLDSTPASWVGVMPELPDCRMATLDTRGETTTILHTPCAGFSKREPSIPLRYPVPGARSQVPGTRHLGPDTRHRIDAEGRIPSTENRARGLSTGQPAHGVCILHPLLRSFTPIGRWAGV